MIYGAIQVGWTRIVVVKVSGKPRFWISQFEVDRSSLHLCVFHLPKAVLCFISGNFSNCTWCIKSEETKGDSFHFVVILLIQSFV